jgi:hypothetical protein
VADAVQSRLHNALATKLVEASHGFDGKPVTARIGTAIKAALPHFVVNYENAVLQIWGESLPYENRLRVHLPNRISADSFSRVFDHAGFIRELTPYLHGNERAERLDAVLTQVSILSKAYNDSLAAMEAARDAFGEARYLLPY